MSRSNAKHASEEVAEVEHEVHVEEVAQSENLPATVKAAEVVQTAGEALPSGLFARLEADAGKGVSTAAEDNIVPIVTILQLQSPQVNKRNLAYIDGAEAGDFLFKSLSPPFISGQKGFLFQPCHFQKKWVEWIPRDSGGGFVAAYDDCPKEAKIVVDDPKKPNKKRYMLPNGNEVIETRYHSGFIHLPGRVMPYVLPMSSSGHTVSKTWMQAMNSLQLPNGKGTVPIFATLYHMTSKERSDNAGHQWFVFEPTFAGYVQSEFDYNRGEALYNAFLSGEKQAEALGDELQTDGAAASVGGAGDAM